MVRKLLQPGSVLILDILLWIVAVLLPTKGRVVADVHVALFFLAVVLLASWVLWLIIPRGLPEEPKPLAKIDPSTGETTVYTHVGGRTNASVTPLLGGGWSIHAEGAQHSPLATRFWYRQPPDRALPLAGNVFAEGDYDALSREYGWHKKPTAP